MRERATCSFSVSLQSHCQEMAICNNLIHQVYGMNRRSVSSRYTFLSLLSLTSLYNLLLFDMHRCLQIERKLHPTVTAEDGSVRHAAHPAHGSDRGGPQPITAGHGDGQVRGHAPQFPWRCEDAFHPVTCV